jgi:hypothetical protein
VIIINKYFFFNVEPFELERLIVSDDEAEEEEEEEEDEDDEEDIIIEDESRSHIIRNHRLIRLVLLKSINIV